MEWNGTSRKLWKVQIAHMFTQEMAHVSSAEGLPTSPVLCLYAITATHEYNAFLSFSQGTKSVLA